MYGVTGVSRIAQVEEALDRRAGEANVTLSLSLLARFGDGRTSES